MQQFIRYCNKMNCESSKLYDTKSSGRERQQQQRRRRRSVSRAHSNNARVGKLVSTASCGDGGVEVFLVHERSRRHHHHHHSHYRHHDHLTISSSLSLSSSSSHNGRNQLRRRKQKGTLVMRGSINDNHDTSGDCE